MLAAMLTRLPNYRRAVRKEARSLIEAHGPEAHTAVCGGNEGGKGSGRSPHRVALCQVA